MRNNLAEQLEGESSEQTRSESSEQRPLGPVYQKHHRFVDSLSRGPVELLEGLEERQYQLNALEAVRKNILDGHPHGQLVLGTGAGKTTIAVNLIANTAGKTLWLAPSNTALQRAIDELQQLKVGKKFQVLNGVPIEPDTEIVFATSQMMLANGKYKNFHPDNFSLIISDEAHHAMGPVTREIFNHFQSFQLYMTATPETTVRHLDSFAKPFFNYTSEDLIRNDGYPPWVLRRYEVPDEKIYEAKICGDNYVLEDGEDVKLLNMPHRFAICLKILKEAVEKGEKAIVFMPSVASSRLFVDEIISKDPALKGKVFHVDGTMKKADVRQMGKEFSASDSGQLAVCCNAIWTESLDIKDIKHVILCDPCCSARILMQRIGRGARPAKGKTHLTIHDVVSVFNNTDAMRSRTLPLSVAGLMGLRAHKDGIVLNGPNRGKQIYEDTSDSKSKVRFVDCTEAEMKEVFFTEMMIDLGFMASAEQTIVLYKKFAEVLDTSFTNLAYRGEFFLKRNEELELKYQNGKRVRVRFKDVFNAAQAFGVQESLAAAAEKDIKVMCKHFKDRAMGVIDEEAVKMDDVGLGKKDALPEDPFDQSRLESLPVFNEQQKQIWSRIFEYAQKLREFNKTRKPEERYKGFELYWGDREKEPERFDWCKRFYLDKKLNWDFDKHLEASARLSRISIEHNTKQLLECYVDDSSEWRSENKQADLLELTVEGGSGDYRISKKDYAAWAKELGIKDTFFRKYFNRMVEARLRGEEFLVIPAKEWTTENAMALDDLDNVISQENKFYYRIFKKGNKVYIPIGHVKINQADAEKPSLSGDPFDPSRIDSLACFSEEERRFFKTVYECVRAKKSDKPNLEITSRAGAQLMRDDTEYVACPYIPDGIWDTLGSASIINNTCFEVNKKEGTVSLSVDDIRKDWSNVRKIREEKGYEEQKLKIKVRQRGRTFIPVGKSNNDENIIHFFKEDKFFAELFQKLITAKLNGDQALKIPRSVWDRKNHFMLSAFVCQLVDGYEGDKAGIPKYFINVVDDGNNIVIPVGHLDVQVVNGDSKKKELPAEGAANNVGPEELKEFPKFSGPFDKARIPYLFIRKPEEREVWEYVFDQMNNERSESKQVDLRTLAMFKGKDERSQKSLYDYFAKVGRIHGIFCYADSGILYINKSLSENKWKEFENERKVLNLNMVGRKRDCSYLPWEVVEPLCDYPSLATSSPKQIWLSRITELSDRRIGDEKNFNRLINALISGKNAVVFTEREVNNDPALFMDFLAALVNAETSANMDDDYGELFRPQVRNLMGSLNIRHIPAYKDSTGEHEGSYTIPVKNIRANFIYDRDAEPPYFDDPFDLARLPYLVTADEKDRELWKAVFVAVNENLNGPVDRRSGWPDYRFTYIHPKNIPAKTRARLRHLARLNNIDLFDENDWTIQINLKNTWKNWEEIKKAVRPKVKLTVKRAENGRFTIVDSSDPIFMEDMEDTVRRCEEITECLSSMAEGLINIKQGERKQIVISPEDLKNRHEAICDFLRLLSGRRLLYGGRYPKELESKYLLPIRPLPDGKGYLVDVDNFEVELADD